MQLIFRIIGSMVIITVVIYGCGVAWYGLKKLWSQPVNFKEAFDIRKKMQEEAAKTLPLPLRNNHSLYQNGIEVGAADGIRIDPDGKAVFFENIFKAERLDETKPLEFRTYRLKLEHYDSKSEVKMGGQQIRSFWRCTCLIEPK